MTAGLQHALTGPWLAARFGVDPVAVEIRRRAGELIAMRTPGSDDWLYPAWQFDDAGEVRPHVARALAAAREADLTHDQLHVLLLRRVGLSGGATMADLLVEGDERPLLTAIRASR